MNKTSKRISVLLVDDHILVRRGFRRILEDESWIAVVGEAGDGETAVQMAGHLRPQIVLMDYALPGMNGALATRALLSAAPLTAVLILSMHSEEARMREALEAGARGYILKSATDMELAPAIKRAAAGELLFDSLSPSSARNAPGITPDPGLSAREIEVLQLIAEGYSNPQIADRLGLSVNTVSVHRANVMKALGTHKTAELVACAIRKGLVNVF